MTQDLVDLLVEKKKHGGTVTLLQCTHILIPPWAHLSRCIKACRVSGGRMFLKAWTPMKKYASNIPQMAYLSKKKQSCPLYLLWQDGQISSGRGSLADTCNILHFWSIFLLSLSSAKLYCQIIVSSVCSLTLFISVSLTHIT